MRTGAIIGTAIAGAVVGAIATLEASERRAVQNYLSDLWDKVPTPQLPENLKNLGSRNVGVSAKKVVKASAKKVRRFANAGRTGDISVKVRGRKRA